MLVAYTGKDYLQIFKVSKETIQKISAGNLDQLKPVKSLGKRVLIVGRDAYLHLRKRYPPLAAGDLKKVVALEAEELFPIKDPAYSFRVFEETASHTLVDVWAWEKALTEKITAMVFPFTHVIPEDAVFISQKPEICIETSGDNTHYIVASSSEGFIGSTLIKGAIKSEQIEIFLKGLGRYGDMFKTLIISDKADTNVVADLKTLPLEVTMKQREYPACIDSVTRVTLGNFALARSDLADIVPVVMRGIIYLLIGIVISFVITGRYYDRAIGEMNKKMGKLSGEMAALTSGPKKEDRQDIVDELKKKLAEGVNPLAVLNMVAGILPEKSNVTRIVLADKNLEITIQGEDPLGLIKEMGKSDMVKSLKLRGSPTKESTGARAPQTQPKRYVFTVVVGLK